MRDGAHRPPGAGVVAFGCLTASLTLAPASLMSGLRPGSGEEAWSDPPGRPRETVGARVLESHFSEGFEEVTAMVARSPELRSWEALRAMLGPRGEERLWYSIQVAWRMDDGDESIVTYVRRPSRDHYHFLEFLAIVEGSPPGPGSAWPIVVVGEFGPMPQQPAWASNSRMP